MSSYKEFFGEFFSSENVPEGGLDATVKFADAQVLGQGREAKKKVVLSFNEVEKRLVVNKVIGTTMEAITGTEDFSKWGGATVHIYVDPNVQFGNKIVSGVRVRKR